MLRGEEKEKTFSQITLVLASCENQRGGDQRRKGHRQEK